MERREIIDIWSINACITPYLEPWSPLAHCDTNERLRDAPLASIINHPYVVLVERREIIGIFPSTSTSLSSNYVMLVERGEVIDIVPPTSTSLSSNSLRGVMLNVSVVHNDVTANGVTWPDGMPVTRSDDISVASPSLDDISVTSSRIANLLDDNLLGDLPSARLACSVMVSSLSCHHNEWSGDGMLSVTVVSVHVKFLKQSSEAGRDVTLNET
jgi:hypothetical protein